MDLLGGILTLIGLGSFFFTLGLRRKEHVIKKEREAKKELSTAYEKATVDLAT